VLALGVWALAVWASHLELADGTNAPQAKAVARVEEVEDAPEKSLASFLEWWVKSFAGAIARRPSEVGSKVPPVHHLPALALTSVCSLDSNFQTVPNAGRTVLQETIVVVEVQVSTWEIDQFQVVEGKELEVCIPLDEVAQRSPNFLLKQAAVSDAGVAQPVVEGARVPEQTLIAVVLKALILAKALACLAE